MATADRARNSADYAKGKIKEVAGKISKNNDLEDEGKDDQSIANVKQAGEKVKDAFRT